MSKTEIIIRIDGMSCMKNCGSTVENALNAIHGVTAKVYFDQKLAQVLIESVDDVKSEALIEAVEEVGFDARLALDDEITALREPPNGDGVKIIILQVSGMSCMKNCGTTVQNALRNVPGVLSANVDFEKKIAAIEAKGGVAIATLIEAVEDAGFDASIDAPATSVPSTAATTTTTTTTAMSKPAAVVSSPMVAVEIELGDMSSLHNTTISVIGMTCSSCVSSVEKCLLNINGVTNVAVNLLSEKADIEYDPTRVTPELLVESVEEIGYDTKVLKTERRDKGGKGTLSKASFNVEGMTCSSCVITIENHLKNQPGIASVSVNLAVNKAMVEYHQDVTGPRNIIESIDDIGFEAELAPEVSDHARIKASREKEIRNWKNLVIFSLIFSTPVFLLHMVFMYLPVIGPWLMSPLIGTLSINSLLQFILSTPVQFISGKKFYVSAWKGMRHGSLGMDFLISFGTSVAYFYSVAMCIQAMFTAPMAMPMHDHDGHSSSDTTMEHSEIALFFETSAVLITFVVLGKYLESNAKVRNIIL